MTSKRLAIRIVASRSSAIRAVVVSGRCRRCISHEMVGVGDCRRIVAVCSVYEKLQGLECVAKSLCVGTIAEMGSVPWVQPER